MINLPRRRDRKVTCGVFFLLWQCSLILLVFTRIGRKKREKAVAVIVIVNALFISLIHGWFNRSCCSRLLKILPARLKGS